MTIIRSHQKELMPAKKVAKKQAVKKVTRSSKKVSQAITPTQVNQRWYLGKWGVIFALAIFLLFATVVAGFSGSGPLASLFTAPSVNRIVDADPNAKGAGTAAQQKQNNELNKALKKAEVADKKKATKGDGQQAPKKIGYPMDPAAACLAKGAGRYVEIIPGVATNCGSDIDKGDVQYAKSCSWSLGGKCINVKNLGTVKCCATLADLRTKGAEACKNLTLNFAGTTVNVGDTPCVAEADGGSKNCMQYKADGFKDHNNNPITVTTKSCKGAYNDISTNTIKETTNAWCCK